MTQRKLGDLLQTLGDGELESISARRRDEYVVEDEDAGVSNGSFTQSVSLVVSGM